MQKVNPKKRILKGFAALFGKHAEPVHLTMEDYQSIGLDRNDAIKLSALARNDEGR